MGVLVIGNLNIKIYITYSARIKYYILMYNDDGEGDYRYHTTSIQKIFIYKHHHQHHPGVLVIEENLFLFTILSSVKWNTTMCRDFFFVLVK